MSKKNASAKKKQYINAIAKKLGNKSQHESAIILQKRRNNAKSPKNAKAIQRLSHLASNYRWLNRSYRNRHKNKIWRLRSFAKNFILKKSKPSDLGDEEILIKQRRRQIEGERNSKDNSKKEGHENG